MTRATRTVLPALLLALSAIPVSAQSNDARFRVSAGAAATTGVGERDPAPTESFGYPFSEPFSLDREHMRTDATRGVSGGPVFWADAQGQLGGGTGVPAGGTSALRPSMLPGIAALSLPIARRAEIDGDTVVVTVGVRYQLHVNGGRLRPYLSGGLGLARTDVEFNVAPYPTAAPTVVSALGARLVSPAMFFPASDVERTRTGVAASGGFGGSFRVFKEVSLDIEARYVQFEHAHMTRLGGGVSYRF